MVTLDASRFAPCVHAPICKRCAIHASVIVVSARNRRATRTLPGPPFRRRPWVRIRPTLPASFLPHPAHWFRLRILADEEACASSRGRTPATPSICEPRSGFRGTAYGPRRRGRLSRDVRHDLCRGKSHLQISGATVVAYPGRVKGSVVVSIVRTDPFGCGRSVIATPLQPNNGASNDPQPPLA